jgi:hypothetical protein
VPSVNYTVASSLTDQGLPTHHMVAESRPLQLIAFDSPHEVTSSVTATVPRHPGHTTHVKRRLYMYAIRIMRHVRLIGVITLAFRMLHILSFTLSYVLILVHILHTLSTCEYLFYSTYACCQSSQLKTTGKAPATAVCLKILGIHIYQGETF